jgi:DedD protein
MEKKKTLLIVISVGLFLVLAIGAALLIFSPKKSEQTSLASLQKDKQPLPATTQNTISTSEAPADTTTGTTGSVNSSTTNTTTPAVNPTEWIKNPQSIQSMQTPPQSVSQNRGDVIIIYGDNAVTTKSPTASNDTGTAKATDTNKIVIEVPKTGTQAPLPDQETLAEKKSNTQTQTKTQAIQTQQLQSETSTRKSNTETKTVTKATTVSSKPVTKSTPATNIIYTDYWIQTGAFTSKVRAESVKEELAMKGISSYTEVKEVQGKTYYRVRLGPYTSKNEAEYWLNLVKSFDGFNDSYISVVQRKQ